MHEKVFADPLNEHITNVSFADERLDIVEKVRMLRVHPHIAKIILGGSIMLIIYFILLQIWGNFFSIELTLFSFAPMYVYIGYIHNLQNTVIMYLLCERNGWIFNPAKDFLRSDKLAQLFPDVFERGIKNPTNEKVTERNAYRLLSNQVWGTLDDSGKNNFWSCIFHYGEGKTSYNQAAFVLEVDTVFPASFSLFRWGERGDLQTESVEFNRLYKIRTHKKNKHNEAQIIKALSPSMQVRLIDFANKFSLDCISFQHNCMVILFSNQIWEAKHTNFFRNVTIDERDVKRYDKFLKEMLFLPLEMKKFVD